MKNRSVAAGIVSLAVLALGGCGSVGVHPVSVGAAKPVNCQLDQYVSERDVDRSYQVACMISSKTGTTLGHDKTASAAINNARDEACGCGADAIVIESSSQEGVRLMTWGQGRAQLKAIRYTD